ncbi:hypothetical protein LIER_42443 [Lithospermum erythrorhizon]|uniref:Tify domain-containing protein n=1 Tax=Lithospermum erythrorhizon TaxID=34254 RepID=A0AAV3RPM6_LITER
MTKRELESKNSLNLSSINQENESASRVRSIVKSNGFVVYTRNKKLKSSVNNNLESNGEFKVTSVDVEVTSQGGECLHNTVITDDLSGIERYRRNDVRVRGRGRGRGRGRRSDMVEVEVKQMEIETEGEGGNVSILRRFTRSALKKSSEGEGGGGGEETGECKDVVVRDDGGGNVASGEVKKAETKVFKRVVIKGRPTTVIEGEQTGEFRDVAVRDAGGENVASGEVKKPETKVFKKIVIKGRPTTVIELFETGLLEDYPVFYHAGKKGIVLRGTVKDIGILCFCSFCMGARVIPPSQFEIHAIKIYKRASQYICMENGKSLLDIVKECSKCSLKALQGMIQTLIGPMPEKESIVCRNCKESFWATSTATMGQVCDSCMIHIRRETNAIRTWRDVNPIKATYVKQRYT